MKTEAIVAAAGIGKRLRAKKNLRKPYLKILGKPILIYTLQQLSESPDISEIIVVVNRLDIKNCLDLLKRYNIKKIKAVIAGGGERSDSVYNGLKMLGKDTDIALIHDGVRPFIDRDLIRKSIDCAKRFGACVVGVPVKATIKRVQGAGCRVQGTVNRSCLWEAQTPQVFRKDLILKAYKKFRNSTATGQKAVVWLPIDKATDDSMLVEKLGVKVKVIMGSYNNIKITTPEDMIIAEAICKTK